MGGPDRPDDFKPKSIPFAQDSSPKSKTPGQTGYGVGTTKLNKVDLDGVEKLRRQLAASALTGNPTISLEETTEEEDEGPKHPHNHPLVTSLLDERARDLILSFLQSPKRVKAGTILAQAISVNDTSWPGSTLGVPVEGEDFFVDLYSIDESQTPPKRGVPIKEKVRIANDQSIPTAAWFGVPPSFTAVASKDSWIYQIPPIHVLKEQGKLTDTDIVYLAKAATGAFSGWLGEANNHPVLEHRNFRPIHINKFSQRAWQNFIKLARTLGGQVIDLKPMQPVLPDQLGESGSKFLIVNGRGPIVRRSDITAINLAASKGEEPIGGDGVMKDRSQIRQFGQIPQLGFIQGEGSRRGVTSLYEYAGWEEITPEAVWVPTIPGSKALVMPIDPSNIRAATMAMTFLQETNQLVMTHNELQAAELGVTEGIPDWLFPVMARVNSVKKWATAGLSR
jgi:hypothetical protein